jgi:hypothetical protein
MAVCESRGCYWSPLEVGSKEPWCFKPTPNQEIQANPFKWIDERGRNTPDVITKNELAFGQFLQTAGQTLLSHFLSGGATAVAKAYYKAGTFDSIINGAKALLARVAGSGPPSQFSRDALALYNLIQSNADAGAAFSKAHTIFKIGAGAIGARDPDTAVRALLYVGHPLAGRLVQIQIDENEPMNENQISAVVVQALSDDMYGAGNSVPADQASQDQFQETVKKVSLYVQSTG